MKIINPNLEFRGALAPLRNPIERLIQHHMAHKAWDVYDVHDFHKYNKEWNGGGYNWWIAFDGTIYVMRGHHVGAHSGRNWNGRSLGIGYQGNFEEQNMTDAQLASGIWLNTKLIKEINKNQDIIVGHNDVTSTLCPGSNFKMDELRKGVKRKLDVSSDEEIYIVVRGDTLGGIASTYGVSLQDVLNANPQIKDKDKISVGQEIVIPIPVDEKDKIKQLKNEKSQIISELNKYKDIVEKVNNITTITID